MAGLQGSLSAKSTRYISYNVSANVSGTEYTLYECPANCNAYMHLIFAANADGNTTLAISWYRTRYSDTFAIIGGKNMVSGEYVQLSNGFIVMEPGDKILVTVTAAGTPNMDVLCTVEEVFRPIG